MTANRILAILSMLFIGWISDSSAFAQEKWHKQAAKFQQGLDNAYADPAHSPLKGDDLLHFEGLEFFPIEQAYCLTADFKRTPEEQPFDMMTSSGKAKRFVKYGELHFQIEGKPLHLAAYQRLSGPNFDKGAKDLFIPFKDWTSGEESYGGGRYMDIPLPQKAKVLLDFNRCYNPYCAYSTGWSCPIPPQENYLEIKILAGVKAWAEH